MHVHVVVLGEDDRVNVVVNLELNDAAPTRQGTSYVTPRFSVDVDVRANDLDLERLTRRVRGGEVTTHWWSLTPSLMTSAWAEVDHRRIAEEVLPAARTHFTRRAMEVLECC